MLCIYLCHIHCYFFKISVYNRNFGVISLLIFKSLNRLLGCFQKGFTHINAQKSNVEGAVMFYAPEVSVSRKSLTLCLADTMCRIMSVELNSVLWNTFSFLLCKMGRPFSFREPHPLCLTNGVKIHYFPAAVRGSNESVRVKEGGVTEKWFREAVAFWSRILDIPGFIIMDPSLAFHH